jgi:hypothetical protein
MDDEPQMDKATMLAASAHDEARDEFARGAVDVVRQVCAVLIGRGVVEADDLRANAAVSAYAAGTGLSGSSWSLLG